MNYLTTDGVLDLALGKQFDSSATMRAKALGWLNEAIQKLYLERDWMCLDRTEDITAASNKLLKPDDYGRIRFAKSTTSGGEFFIAEKHRLTDEEDYLMTDDSDADPVPSGFYETLTHVGFRPGATGTVTLGYVCIIPEYADDETTILDLKFKNVLTRAVNSAIYEYEEDQRHIPSVQLDQVELNRLKSEENRQKPKPKRSKYLRGYK